MLPRKLHDQCQIHEYIYEKKKCMAGSGRLEYFSMFGPQDTWQNWSSSQIVKGLVCPTGDRASNKLEALSCLGK